MLNYVFSLSSYVTENTLCCVICSALNCLLSLSTYHTWTQLVTQSLTHAQGVGYERGAGKGCWLWQVRTLKCCHPNCGSRVLVKKLIMWLVKKFLAINMVQKVYSCVCKKLLQVLVLSHIYLFLSSACKSSKELVFRGNTYIILPSYVSFH